MNTDENQDLIKSKSEVLASNEQKQDTDSPIDRPFDTYEPNNIVTSTSNPKLTSTESISIIKSDDSCSTPKHTLDYDTSVNPKDDVNRPNISIQLSIDNIGVDGAEEFLSRAIVESSSQLTADYKLNNNAENTYTTEFYDPTDDLEINELLNSSLVVSSIHSSNTGTNNLSITDSMIADYITRIDQGYSDEEIKLANEADNRVKVESNSPDQLSSDANICSSTSSNRENTSIENASNSSILSSANQSLFEQQVPDVTSSNNIQVNDKDASLKRSIVSSSKQSSSQITDMIRNKADPNTLLKPGYNSRPRYRNVVKEKGRSTAAAIKNIREARHRSKIRDGNGKKIEIEIELVSPSDDENESRKTALLFTKTSKYAKDKKPNNIRIGAQRNETATINNTPTGVTTNDEDNNKENSEKEEHSRKMSKYPENNPHDETINVAMVEIFVNFENMYTEYDNWKITDKIMRGVDIMEDTQEDIMTCNNKSYYEKDDNIAEQNLNSDQLIRDLNRKNRRVFMNKSIKIKTGRSNRSSIMCSECNQLKCPYVNNNESRLSNITNHPMKKRKHNNSSNKNDYIHQNKIPPHRSSENQQFRRRYRSQPGANFYRRHSSGYSTMKVCPVCNLPLKTNPSKSLSRSSSSHERY